MGAFVAGVVTGLVAGLSAAAPWLVYARGVSPSLERAEARPAAYVVAMLPAVLATVATAARLFGFTTGWFQVDVALIAATIAFACSWSPIAHGALYVTGGPKPMQRDPYAADADEGAGVRGTMRNAACMSEIKELASQTAQA